MREYSIAAAKDGIAQLVREAEAGQDIQLTRHGKPVAIVVGAGRYQALTSNRTGFWESYQRFLRERDPEEADLRPDEVFTSVRDDSPGRDFSW